MANVTYDACEIAYMIYVTAAGTDVTKAAFISGALRELGVSLCVENELVYREGLHVYAAAGGTHARMGMHVPTANVT
jgi:energy-converting hydrogenase Eha subunit G